MQNAMDDIVTKWEFRWPTRTASEFKSPFSVSLIPIYVIVKCKANALRFEQWKSRGKAVEIALKDESLVRGPRAR